MSKEKKLVAKLVTFVFITRVIVEENTDESAIIEKCRDKIVEKAKNELHENFEQIADDLEMPFSEDDLEE